MRRLLPVWCSLLLLVAGSCKKDKPTGEAVPLDEALVTRAGFVPDLDGPLRPLSATPVGAMLSLLPDQAVAVTFSKPMVPLGDDADRPAPDGALRLSPNVPGTLRWEGTQTLIFQPTTPLPFGTSYTATLRGGLKSVSGAVMSGDYSWQFETPRPILQSSAPTDGETWVAHRPRIDLVFNQPMAGGRAGGRVTLQPVGGSPIPATMGGRGDTLSIRPNANLQPGTRYQVIFPEGLTGTGGPLGMTEGDTVRFTTYGPLKLVGLSQERNDNRKLGYDPGRGITVQLSNPVRFGDLRRALSFAPGVPVPVGIEAQDGVVSDAHTLPFDWTAEQAYTLTVRNLKDAFGQTLGSASASFKTRPYEPSVRIPTDIVTVEADAQPNGLAALPMTVVNLPTVRVGMRRVRAEQVIPSLPTYDGNHYYGDEDAPTLPGAVPKIPASRAAPVSLRRNELQTLPLRLDSMLTGGVGLVAVRVVGPPPAGSKEPRDYAALAVVTRLGVTAKFSPHQNLIVVTNLKTSKPTAGATVSIRGADNKVYWRGKTDGQGRALSPGWAALKLPKPSEWSAPRQFAFAELNGDLAFTSSEWTDGLEPYRFGLNYEYNPQPETNAGEVFSDRGLYKGGETVHLKAILRRRTDRDWSLIRDSVRVFVRSPLDQVLLDLRLKPNDLGAVNLDWSAPTSAPQGEYTVRIARASDPAAATRSLYESGDLAQGSFRVDAFRRATFAVTPRALSPHYVAGDFFEASLTGRYLFGAAMQNAEASYVVEQRPSAYTPPGYEGYLFGAGFPGTGEDDDGSGRSSLYRTLLGGDTTLSADGSLNLRTQLPLNPTGVPTQLSFSGTVTDPARQDGYGMIDVTVHPALYYVGLKPKTTFLDLSETKSLPVDLVAVDPAGRPVGKQNLTVSLVKQNWTSVRQIGADGRLHWSSKLEQKTVATMKTTSEARSAKRLSFTVAEGGSYVLRATGHDVRGNTVRTEAYLYATGAGYVAWRRDDDDRIELVPERTSYKPGETAKLLVQSPYETATALITVEREGILSSRVETLTGSAPEIAIPLTDEHLPNVFVSVILLSGRTGAPGAGPAGRDVGKPGFKMGYASLRVDPGTRHLTVEVTPNAKTYRPGDEVTVELRLKDSGGKGVPGEIAFSAADAGVLNLINYRLPDPFDTFYGPRGLAVSTSETRATLVEQRNYGQKAQNRGGGGGDPKDQTRRDFRPSANWTPSLRTDGSGRAKVTFKLPESLTTFRLMATAHTASSLFGAGRTDIVVTQPLVVQAALPRFLRLGDVIQAGVLVTNTTGKPGTATVSASATGVTLTGPASQQIALADGQTKEVRFSWTVPTVGEAKFTFNATLGGEKDGLVWPLPIGAPSIKTVSATFASTDGSTEEALVMPAGRVAGLGSLEVRASSTALVGLDGAIQYLFDYPYGCLEQRTSAVRPLLVAKELLDAFKLVPIQGRRDEAIDGWLSKLTDFWAGTGFSLWSGERYPHPYVSAYVVMALAEARAAGYGGRIPADVERQAVEALERYATNASYPPALYAADVWTDTRAFMLYALARHGRVLEPEIAALAARPSALSIEGQSDLLRTIALVKRPGLDGYRQPLLDGIRSLARVEATVAYLAAPQSDRYDWIFASDTRTTARGLVALIEADPASEATKVLAEKMVRWLITAQSSGHWASTQDNIGTVEALRAYFRAYEAASPSFTAEVQLAGRAILSQAFSGRSLTPARTTVAGRALPAAGERVPLTISKRGTGSLYYWLRLESYSRAPLPAAANGLTVERRLQLLGADGRPTGAAMTTGGRTITLQPGQLVKVTLRLVSPGDRTYVVVDDGLPAGLEPLNGAFATTGQNVLANADAGEGGEDRWWGSFNHTEMKDDRVLLFSDYLNRGEHTYSYVARATTPGTFVHPPATAEMMYQPETNGRTASGILVVQPPAATARR